MAIQDGRHTDDGDDVKKKRVDNIRGRGRTTSSTPYPTPAPTPLPPPVPITSTSTTSTTVIIFPPGTQPTITKSSTYTPPAYSTDYADSPDLPSPSGTQNRPPLSNNSRSPAIAGPSMPIVVPSGTLSSFIPDPNDPSVTSSSSSPSNLPQSAASRSSNAGAIAGGVIAAFLLIAFAALAVFVVRRRRRNRIPPSAMFRNADPSMSPFRRLTESPYSRNPPDLLADSKEEP